MSYIIILLSNESRKMNAIRIKSMQKHKYQLLTQKTKFSIKIIYFTQELTYVKLFVRLRLFIIIYGKNSTDPKSDNNLETQSAQ